MASTPRQRLFTRVALGGLALSLSCASDPPVCPTGDCTLPGRTILHWSFNAYPDLLFSGDTCRDLDAKTVHVEVVGIDDPMQFDTQDVPCEQKQASFLGLPAGNYRISIDVRDAADTSLIAAPVSTETIAGAPDTPVDVLIDVPFESWVRSYTGTLLFRLSWAGMSCEMAVPPVMTQTLTLVAGGQPTSMVTDMGQKLDGTDPKPCRKLSEQFAQFVEGLPMGPATFTVTGNDVNGDLAFEHAFDTFIGAAKNNPTITYDVTTPPVDGGVDGGGDGGVDGGMADSGL